MCVCTSGLCGCVIDTKPYVLLLLPRGIGVCGCLPSHRGLCLPCYLSSSPHSLPIPQGDCRPVLRRRLQWAAAEMAVLRMKLTVALTWSPRGPPALRHPRPTQKRLLGRGKGFVVPVLGFGGEARCKGTLSPSTLTSRRGAQRQRRLPRDRCLATWETFLQTH